MLGKHLTWEKIEKEYWEERDEWIDYLLNSEAIDTSSPLLSSGSQAGRNHSHPTLTLTTCQEIGGFGETE